LILLFGDIGANGVQDNQSLARGIAVALNTTMMGLLIAVPALTAWSSFSKKVEVMAVELEAICSDFVKRTYQVQPESLKSKGQEDVMVPKSKSDSGSAKSDLSA
jgi:biopolymer transport protein ExbB